MLQIDALLDHLSFGRMRNNDAVNMKPPKGAVPDEVRDKINFIRKGAVGGWKDDFEGHDDAKQELEAWVEKNAPSVDVEIPYDV